MKEGKARQYALDSIMFYDWISASGEWLKTQSNLYFHDHRLNDTLQLIRTCNSSVSQWINKFQFKRYFNQWDALTEQVNSQWSATGSTWLNVERRIFEYHDGTQPDHTTVQVWNAINASWENKSKYSYGFDNEGHWIFYLKQNWDTVQLKYQYVYQFLYTYSSGLKTEMIRQDWDPDHTTWVDRNKISYHYDTDERLSQEIGLVWDRESALWDSNSWIHYLRYPEGRVAEKIYQARHQSGWYFTAKYAYEYNELGWLTRIIYYTSENGNDAWASHSMYRYEYNEYGDLVDETWYAWNRNEWVPDYKIEYFGRNVDLSLPPVSDGILLTIYPNPTHHSLHIVYGGRHPGEAVVHIIDINGWSVYRTPLQHPHTHITDLNLPGGLYWVCIQARDHRTCKKLMVIE
jgi:hypothetical protein